jgi:hypothetical protein
MFIRNTISGYEYIIYPVSACILLLFLILLVILYAIAVSKHRKLRYLNKLINKNSSVESLENTIKQKQIQIEALSLNYDTIRQNAIKLQADLKQNVDLWKQKNGIINLQAKINELTIQKNEFENALSELQVTAQKQIFEIKSNKIQSEELQKNIVIEQSTLIQLNHKSENLRIKINSLCIEVQTNENELTKLRAQIELQNSKISKAEISKATDNTNEEQQSETIIKRIGYIPNNHFRNYCFPAVYMPNANSAIKFPRKADRGIKGATEGKFLLSLQKHFSKHLYVFDDRIVAIADNSRPYEPDFTLQNERNGLNLFMDIEIDEPYDGNSRVATHYSGADDYRNQYFCNRGWIVIRFSEKQIVANALGCCRLIAEVIASVDTNYVIAEALSQIAIVEKENFWSKFQAEQWAEETIREKYLGITKFEPQTNLDTVRNSQLILNNAEKQADSEANDKLIPEPVVGVYNQRNKHVRDSSITFYPANHIYIVNNSHLYTSVSTLIDRFFPFDKEGAAIRVSKTRGITVEEALHDFENAKTQGTILHSYIHNFLQSDGNDIPDINPEIQPAFNQFKHFRDTHLADKEIYRTEWAIYDEDAGIAGTCDLVVVNEDGTYTLYDWKRTKGIWRTGFEGQTGIGIFSDMQNCNFNKYSLQLNLYKQILERKYKLNISKSYIVQFYPLENPYELIEANVLSDKTTELYIFAKENPLK